MSQRYYFGPPPWRYEDIRLARERPIPVGAKCLYCPEPIGEGDHGGWMSYINGEGQGSIEPYHYECHLVCTFGSPMHVAPILDGTGDTACSPAGKCQRGFTRRELGRGIIDELIKYNSQREG